MGRSAGQIEAMSAEAAQAGVWRSTGRGRCGSPCGGTAGRAAAPPGRSSPPRWGGRRLACVEHASLRPPNWAPR